MKYLPPHLHKCPRVRRRLLIGAQIGIHRVCSNGLFWGLSSKKQLQNMERISLRNANRAYRAEYEAERKFQTIIARDLLP